MSEVKTIHVIKDGIKTLDDAYIFGKAFIAENNLESVSFNISEAPSAMNFLPPHYEVQIEGVVKSGEPDQVDG